MILPHSRLVLARLNTLCTLWLSAGCQPGLSVTASSCSKLTQLAAKKINKSNQSTFKTWDGRVVQSHSEIWFDFFKANSSFKMFSRSFHTTWGNGKIPVSCNRCVVDCQHLTAAAFSQNLSPFFSACSFKPDGSSLKRLFSLQSPRRPAPTCHRSGSPGHRGAGLWSGSGAAAEAPRSPAAPSWERRCLGWPRCGCS